MGGLMPHSPSSSEGEHKQHISRSRNLPGCLLFLLCTPTGGNHAKIDVIWQASISPDRKTVIDFQQNRFPRRENGSVQHKSCLPWGIRNSRAHSLDDRRIRFCVPVSRSISRIFRRSIDNVCSVFRDNRNDRRHIDRLRPTHTLRFKWKKACADKTREPLDSFGRLDVSLSGCPGCLGD